MSRIGRPFQPSLLRRDDVARLKGLAVQAATEEPFKTVRNFRDLAGASASEALQDSGECATSKARLAVAASLLADLREQGWGLGVEAGSLAIFPPSAAPEKGETVAQAKDRHRQALLKGSDRQLASPGVQEFLSGMEKFRAFGSKVVSIHSLVDDGTELSALLTPIAELESALDRARRLEKVIRPFVQVCDADQRCEQTGLKLQDIWRYFRHTWSLEYNSMPGRTLRLLVRNRARPNWPVIGIAMLASPAANLWVRDRWIGWTPDELAHRLVAGRWKPTEAGRTLMAAVQESIGDIRTDDLVEPDELYSPTRSTLFKLHTIVAKAESKRLGDLKSRDRGEGDGQLVDIRCVDKEALSPEDWRQLSGTSLFIRKRAEQLIPLLQTWSYMKGTDFEKHPGAALMEALVSKRGREAVSVALNEIKKRHLASQVADIAVCGAIPPYNHLLGGKLVALLMASKEVRQIYRSRYSTQVSEIASQLAGRPICRSADLKVLTTTSLYGINSSQYNRLKLNFGKDTGLKEGITWQELARTEGYTVTHVSRSTVEHMRTLGTMVYGTRRVNSVFGEGSSPRTRQIREGLNLIGINNDSVLQHSLVRRVYACELYDGARDDLLGFPPRGRRSTGEAVASVTRGWIRRWLGGRVQSGDVLASVAAAAPADICSGLRGRAARALLSDSYSPDVDEYGQLKLAC